VSAKPKHDPPTQTWDCPHCGETFWIKEGDPVGPCACGCALTMRPVGEGKGEFVMFLQMCNEEREGDDE
jgi:hypothetical protein